MNLMIQMKKAKDLTQSERLVVDYILAYPEKATKMKIVELASETFTSSATVLRLVRKLGIESYIDFRVKLAEDVYNYLREEVLFTNNEPIEYDSSIESIIENVTAMNTIAIRQTMSLNSADMFRLIANLMKHYPVIDYYGIGHSSIVAQDAVIKSLRLGIHATTFSDDGSQMIASKIANRQRLAFLISYTGETNLIVEAARNLMKTGTPTVSFTANTDNTLSQLCNYNLYVNASESIYTLGHMSSRMAFLNLFDILFTVYANLDYSGNMEILKRTYTYKRKEDV